MIHSCGIDAKMLAGDMQDRLKDYFAKKGCMDFKMPGPGLGPGPGPINRRQAEIASKMGLMRCVMQHLQTNRDKLIDFSRRISDYLENFAMGGREKMFCNCDAMP